MLHQPRSLTFPVNSHAHNPSKNQATKDSGYGQQFRSYYYYYYYDYDDDDDDDDDYYYYYYYYNNFKKFERIRCSVTSRVKFTLM